MKCPWSFPNRSWVDLHHVYNISTWNAFHFRDYQNYFCLLLALSVFTFGKLLTRRGWVRIIYIEGQCSKNEKCCRHRAQFTFTDARYTRFTPLMFHLDRNNHLLYLKEVLAARQASLDRDSTLDCKGHHEFCMGKVR
jgi:hypothetical protein